MLWASQLSASKRVNKILLAKPDAWGREVRSRSLLRYFLLPSYILDTRFLLALYFRFQLILGGFLGGGNSWVTEGDLRSLVRGHSVC